MKRSFTVGDDYFETDDSMCTFGITEDRGKCNNESSHTNKIEVYGDEDLRNLIIYLLNEHLQKEGKLL